MEAGVPSSTVSTFTDPDAYHAAIRHTHAEGIVTGRGQFRAELILVRLNRVSLHRSEEALPRLTYSAVDPALFLVAFPVHRDQQLYLGGLEMAHGDIFAFRAGSEAYNRLPVGLHLPDARGHCRGRRSDRRTRTDCTSGHT